MLRIDFALIKFLTRRREPCILRVVGQVYGGRSLAATAEAEAEQVGLGGGGSGTGGTGSDEERAGPGAHEQASPLEFVTTAVGRKDLVERTSGGLWAGGCSGPLADKRATQRRRRRRLPGRTGPNLSSQGNHVAGERLRDAMRVRSDGWGEFDRRRIAALIDREDLGVMDR